MQRPGVVMIGPSQVNGPMEVVGDAATLLGRSRHKILTHRNVIGAQYNKLVLNTLGAAASLSATEFLREGILYRPWRDAVAIPLQQESLEVLARSGVRLGRVPGVSDAYRFRRLLRLLDWPAIGPLAESAVRAAVGGKPVHFSLAADLRLGKPTEVDWINGEIVRRADAHGLPAPRNAKVVELVHELEQRGEFFSREQVISIFRQLAGSASSGKS
jgi:2-dehydropantoate 2-reductase